MNMKIIDTMYEDLEMYRSSCHKTYAHILLPYCGGTASKEAEEDTSSKELFSIYTGLHNSVCQPHASNEV